MVSTRKETRTMGTTPIVDWALIDWRKAEQTVYRLQKRIFTASRRGNVQVVHNLQRKLMRSYAARLLAVRRVTQDNQGKKTAGVDGKTALTATERADLVQALDPKRKKRRKPLPVRRVWIPKPGKQEKRPLGIPTIATRAEQALAKQALEPEWEAKFEPNSYGFRPGRSCHDAREAIFNAIRFKAKYALDADIKGCFDHLSHQALLKKLGTYPALRRAIYGWLKAGVMEGLEFSPTEEGAPQGSVLSPLLANVALHGMEALLTTRFRKGQVAPITIRYADDFVILHPERTIIEQCRGVVEDWLRDIGLELKPSKTRITHTLHWCEGNRGFVFLGFQVRQYPVGKYHTGKDTHGRPLGFKTLITPSQEAVQRHLLALKQLIRQYRGAPQEALIAHLNPVIRGWANYYQTTVASHCFHKVDHLLFQMVWSWARWRHSAKGGKWRKQRYWRSTDGEKWVFAPPEGARLTKHSFAKSTRHIKVEGSASPYDGKLVYWAKRKYNHPLTRKRMGYVLRMQQGRCAACGLYLKDGDVIELDHIIPKSLGGKEETNNLQALHRHCHDQKTAKDASGKVGGQGIHDKDSSAEEPDDEKSSCPVL